MVAAKNGGPQAAAFVVADVGGDESSGRLPVVVKLPTLLPQNQERWQSYRSRVHSYMANVHDMLNRVMGANASMLYSANSLQANLSPDQVNLLMSHQQVEHLELDPVVQVVQMDDALVDIELAALRGTHPNLDGSGVTVAVLDSGADDQHPHLKVKQSYSTCGESTNIPGSHGTHCAGSIASRDSVYPGVAPGVDLLNIKVLSANGSGKHTDILKGIDQAIDAGAQVISISIGFNHLPTWSMEGTGGAAPTPRYRGLSARAEGHAPWVFLSCRQDHRPQRRICRSRLTVNPRANGRSHYSG